MESHARFDERPSYRAQNQYQDSTSDSDDDCRYNEEDSRLNFRSSLPVLGAALRQRGENRFNSRVFSATKASSASNWAEEYVPSFQYDAESRDWVLKYRKSTPANKGSSWKSQARSHSIFRDASPDVETNYRRIGTESTRLNSNKEYTWLNTSQSNMYLKTRMYELSYPVIAQGVEVVYTTDELEAEKWLRDNVIDCSVGAVGFDIEWKPQFVSKKNGGIENETAVLQLAVENSCLVLHIYHMERLPESLKRVLRDEEILKVGSGIKQDSLKLKRDRGLVLKGSDDIQFMAKKMDPFMRKTGMQALAQTFLGTQLDKSAAMSNWETFPLTFRQIEYAALDAWIGLKIFHKMTCHLFSQESTLSTGQCLMQEHCEENSYIREEKTKSRYLFIMVLIFFCLILFCVFVHNERPRT